MTITEPEKSGAEDTVSRHTGAGSAADHRARYTTRSNIPFSIADAVTDGFAFHSCVNKSQKVEEMADTRKRSGSIVSARSSIGILTQSMERFYSSRHILGHSDRLNNNEWTQPLL